jgi:hypothetical protein
MRKRVMVLAVIALAVSLAWLLRRHPERRPAVVLLPPAGVERTAGPAAGVEQTAGPAAGVEQTAGPAAGVEQTAGAPSRPPALLRSSNPPPPDNARPQVLAAAPAQHPSTAATGPEPGDRASEPWDRTKLRFEARWGTPGLCGSQNAGRAATRSALLATFAPVARTPTPVFRDPGGDPVVLAEIFWFLGYAAHHMQMPGGLSPAPAPPIYVYKDIDQMRSVSCINQSAIGYYDGAIHVVGDMRLGSRQIEETLIHEYVHYFLDRLGIRAPMWLHEGMAMQAADETWWRDPSLGVKSWLLKEHLPFNAMVSAFPDTADEKFATAVYFQSLMMVTLVQARQRQKTLANLLDALANKRILPEEAFSWSTRLSGDDLERAWKYFLKDRFGGALD